MFKLKIRNVKLLYMALMRIQNQVSKYLKRLSGHSDSFQQSQDQNWMTRRDQTSKVSSKTKLKVKSSITSQDLQQAISRG